MERIGSSEFTVGKPVSMPSKKKKARRMRVPATAVNKMQAWARRSSRHGPLLRP